MKIKFGLITISLITISLITISLIIVTLPVYAETSSIFSQSVYDNTFTKNATNPIDPALKINTFYMLAGEMRDYTYISTIHMNTHNIPKSDIWNDVKIDTSTVKLLVMLGEGQVEKYLLTIHICTDDYEKKLTDRWLNGQSNSLPYSTIGDYQTEDCTRTSSQDSVVISKFDLPQIVKLDVTGLTREIIELGSREIIYVVTVTPLDEHFDDSSKVPTRKLGTLALASGGSQTSHSSNILPILEIKYSSNPTSTVSILQNTLIVVPPVFALILSIILYWHSQKRNQSTILKRNVESLIIEIRENTDALNGNRNYQIIQYNFKDNNITYYIKYTNCFLDDDGYNSILASGEFTYFKTDTQKILRELYTRIRDHNEQIKYTNKLEDQILVNKIKVNVIDVVRRYDVNITLLETEIIPLFSQAITQLNTENKKQTNSVLHYLRFLRFGFFSRGQS